jgi:hypothetical protein
MYRRPSGRFTLITLFLKQLRFAIYGISGARDSRPRRPEKSVRAPGRGAAGRVAPAASNCIGSA